MDGSRPIEVTNEADPGEEDCGSVLTFIGALLVLVVCTIGPVYSMRLRLAPVVTGSLIDDARTNLVFGFSHVANIGAVTLYWVRRWRSSPADLRERGASIRFNGVVFQLTVFHALVAMSSIWSIVAVRSLTQASLFALTTLSAFCIGSWVTIRQLCILLTLGHQVLLAVSGWSVVRRWPGAVDENGDWAGIFLNKNSLGPVAAIAIVSAVALVWFNVNAHGSTRISVGLLLLAAADVVFLKKADSLTASVGTLYAVCAAALVWAIAVRAHRGGRASSRPIGLGLVSAFVGSVAAVSAGRGLVASTLGRSPTLSGRTELWAWVLDRLAERPVVGWGWLAVWEDPTLKAQVVERFGIPFATAHNGLLETMVGAGVPAGAILIVIVWSLLRPIVRSCTPNHSGRPSVGSIVAVGMASYVVAVNQLETFVGANLLPWLLLVIVSGAAGRSRRSSLQITRPAR